MHCVAVGHVWLVGAGPGDPDLITVRGRDLLSVADVVVTDRLVSAALRARIPPGVEVIDVGKRPGRPTVGQEEINALLIERARAGALVVRLKGGDPYVLGRGGEEARACAAAGVGATVVPGVTSALAAPAYAGIPVTDRELAQDVAIVSGHLAPGHPDSTVDWAALGASRMTVVVLMGIARLADIAAALVAGGRDPDTPAAVIERATTPAQRVVRGRLMTIAVDALAAGVRSPAVTVIGAVAARADGVPPLPGSTEPEPARGHAFAARADGVPPLPGSTEPEPAPGHAFAAGDPALAFDEVAAPTFDEVAAPAFDNTLASAFDDAPAGPPGARARVRVLIPRTRDRTGLLAARLRALGAEPLEVVVSRLGPVEDPAPPLVALAGADALVLAGADEVDALVSLLLLAGRDVRALAGIQLLAADAEAEAALARRGLAARRTTARAPAVGAGAGTGWSVLVAASASALTDALPPPAIETTGSAPAGDRDLPGAASPGGQVPVMRRIQLLRDILAEPDPAVAAALAAGEIDAVAFASSTAVRAFAALYGAPPSVTRVAAVGARTARACDDAGFPADAVATEPGIYPLADAVARALEDHGSSGDLS